MAIVTIRRHGVTSGCPGTGSAPGIKEAVHGWSQSSTRSNVRFLQSIDESSLDGFGFAVTLTVKRCPESHEAWERARRAWVERIRRLGFIRLHWVTEWQRRGVPHLHAAVYLPTDSPKPLIDAWLAVASGFGSTAWGQHVAAIYDQTGFSQYVAKHAARGLNHYQRSRSNVPRGWEKTGRMWGKSGAWPIGSEVKLLVDQAAWHRFRRLVRNYRIADARQDKPAIRGRRIASARRMLQAPKKELSAVRGVSEWIDSDTALQLLRVSAALDQVIHL